MVDLETARNVLLSLPLVDEYDHFGKPAYRVGKKIFATLWLDNKRAVIKLSKLEQPLVCDEYKTMVFPVKSNWGRLGWTNVELEKVSDAAFKKLIALAWANVASKTAVKKYAGGLNL
ncbi:MAG TPA: MmcQ/YjbR family DNA-binding protein [Cyclobacteriaceae bacterium]|nr:MmcQ/YjbR family DNA-binding protein [Cyclobacteriaceae bacterium]